MAVRCRCEAPSRSISCNSAATQLSPSRQQNTQRTPLPFIALDRRFFEWRSEDNELSDPDVLSGFGLSDGAKSWDAVLKRRQVVILAEAGSGKTEELKECRRAVAAEGKFAFYATVQDVGREGLKACLSTDDQTALVRWQASNKSAWFFVDSIDEAKLDNIRLDRALRAVASCIHGAEGRAYVILSGRHTDWEFCRDLERLEQILPLRPDVETPPAPDPEALLIKVLRHEHTEDNTVEAEKPLVLVLASLDKDRVRRFAMGKSAPNVDDFLAEVETLNLWRFARRPLDLDWLVQFWRTHGRMGSLSEMLATSLHERSQETDPYRVRRDPIEPGRTLAALERVGAALVFGRAVTITIPDNEIALTGDSNALDLGDILPDWPAADRVRFFNLPVFDPATFGRVRLHNDNEGVVRAYLAARWLLRLHELNSIAPPPV